MLWRHCSVHARHLTSSAETDASIYTSGGWKLLFHVIMTASVQSVSLRDSFLSIKKRGKKKICHYGRYTTLLTNWLNYNFTIYTKQPESNYLKYVGKLGCVGCVRRWIRSFLLPTTVDSSRNRCFHLTTCMTLSVRVYIHTCNRRNLNKPRTYNFLYTRQFRTVENVRKHLT